jgi:nitrate reductase gamma subunit
MRLKGRLILITGFVMTLIFAGSKALISTIYGELPSVQSIALVILSGVHFYLLDVKKYHNARFSYGFLLSAPAALALLFFPYNALEQVEHALMLAFNVALLHVGILIMFSKHVTMYLTQSPQNELDK